MDLGLRTQEALDWHELLSVLSGYCRLDATVKWLFGELDSPGALLATTLQEVQESYQLTEEIWLLVLKSETIPISSVVDCRFALEQIERGSPLDLGDWLRVRDGIVSLRSIQRWLSKRNDVNRLVQTFGNAYIDPVVIDTLEQSFDDRGEISESYYPNLGRLRQKVEQVKKALDTEVRRLLQDDGITKHLQENYVTERNGRVVFPMKTSYPYILTSLQVLPSSSSR